MKASHLCALACIPGENDRGAIPWSDSYLLHGVLVSLQNACQLIICRWFGVPLTFSLAAVAHSSFLVDSRIPFKNKQKY